MITPEYTEKKEIMLVDMSCPIKVKREEAKNGKYTEKYKQSLELRERREG